MFDSHCHLHDSRVSGDADALIARAEAAGVLDLMLAGVDPRGWRDEVALQQRHPRLRISYGVHPQVVRDEALAQRMVDDLERSLAGELPRPAALGEIGLDGLEENAPFAAAQEAVFLRQLGLAKRHDLPVLLHVLRAHPRALELLEGEGVPRRGGVLHSCSASGDLCKRYLALGLSISFAGTVCDEGARRIRAAVGVVPLDRLLVETDAPDQTPKQRRPARNEPAFLVEIVAALAQIRGEPAETIARVTRENAIRLFDEG